MGGPTAEVLEGREGKRIVLSLWDLSLEIL